MFPDLRFPEARQIDVIRDCEARYTAEFGAPPFDLSHWDSNDEFKQAITRHLLTPLPLDVGDYIYASALGERRSVAAKLGFDSKVEVVITPSATVSLLFVAASLAHIGVKTAFVITPTYFSVPHVVRLCGMDCVQRPVRREDDNFALPPLADLTEDETCLWLSHPLFCTGRSIDPYERTAVLEAANRGVWVVIDEALAAFGNGMHRKLGTHPKIISVHSPHKALCLNAFKFGAIVHPPELFTYFNRWSDVIYGGLSTSTAMAVQHFLTPAFDELDRTAVEFIENARRSTHAIVQKTESLCFDYESTGFFVSCFAKRLGFDRFDQPADLWQIVRDTGTLFISGSRNKMPHEAGFSFRVNLTRDGLQFRGALTRLCCYLDSLT